MHKKRALVLWAYLCLLTLAACGPKVIDDSDLVSFDYKYTLDDWTVVEEWSASLTVWENSKYQWLESTIRWAKQDDEFNGTIAWWDLYGYAYDENMIQSYPNLIMTEVLWISDPKIWDSINVSSFGDGVIVSDGKDDEWYTYWVVDFNDPKTYSDLSYSVKITDIEKN
jgi:FKBP-type peptidyl-prolyl cis-trans isomerase 2